MIARLLQDLPARIDKIAGAIKLADVPGRLRSHAIDRADVDAVGNRGGGLLQIPEILAQARDGGRWVNDQLRAVQRQRPPALGEMAVVADIDAELAERRVEHRIAGIAWLEEELFIEARYLRDVDLAEFAEILAVGIDDGGGVVVDAGHFLFVERHHD